MVGLLIFGIISFIVHVVYGGLFLIYEADPFSTLWLVKCYKISVAILIIAFVICVTV